MKNSLKPENIIEEIQFELAQGLIRKEELGEAIRSVRNFSNKIRKEILENYPLDGKLREIFRKQFQLIEMLIKLIEENALLTQNLKIMINNRRVVNPGLDNNIPLDTPAVRKADSSTGGENLLLNQNYYLLNQEEILKVIAPKTLKIDMPITRGRTSLTTKIMSFLKLLYHRPAFFYTLQLGEKQEKINNIFGYWLMKIYTNSQLQQDQINRLNEQWSLLEKGTEKSELKDIL